jgi:hypothetical protein
MPVAELNPQSQTGNQKSAEIAVRVQIIKDVKEKK